MESKEIKVRETTKEVVLPKKADLRTYLFKRFLEKFGTDEIIDLYHTDRKAFIEKYKNEVTDCEDGCVSLAEYQEWIELIRKLLPKKYSKREFDREIIVVDFVMGPMSYEAAEEIKENKKAAEDWIDNE